MQEETITIPLKEYNDLIDSQAWLDALESAGVDNWSGYDYAVELYKEDTGKNK